MVLIAQVQCLEIIPSYDQGSLWPFYMLSLHLIHALDVHIWVFLEVCPSSTVAAFEGTFFPPQV